MDLLLKKLLEDNIFYDVFLIRGIEQFLDSIPNVSHTINNGSVEIYSTCNKNKIRIILDNNYNLIKSNCDCDNFKNYNGFCKHIVSTLYQFFYDQTIMNKKLIYQCTSYNISFLIDAFNNKIILTPQFNLFSKPHSILDVLQLLDGKIKINFGKTTHELLLKEMNSEYWNILDILFNELNVLKKFNNKSYILDQNKFYSFLEYCWSNNIKLYNEKDKTELISLNFVSKEFIDEKIAQSFFNKKITIKKNYNGLYCCKTDFTITEHFCELEKSIFFLNNPMDKFSLVHVVDSPNTYEKCRNFYWQFNHGSAKNDFIHLYEYINSNFADFNLNFDYSIINKHNLLNKDPKLSLELRYNNEINNPILIIKYLYLDKYYYVNDIKTDVEIRNTEMEQKLLKKIEKMLTIYSEKYNGYIFNNQEEFYKIVRWMKLNKNSENYDLKIAKNLIFKVKQKTKFSISGLTKKEDLLQINWTLSDYSKEDINKIIYSYIQKQEFVKLSNDEIINLLNDIDFDDFENQLKLFNANFDDFLQNKVFVQKWNYSLLNNFSHENEDVNKFISNFKHIDEIRVSLPDKLLSILKPYQLYGIKWLKLHHKLNTGSILADEMGLGKTIQSIGFLSDYFCDKKDNFALIVSPSSLIYNWKKEFEVYASHLKICVIDGNVEKRDQLFKQLSKYDVVIISYNLLKINLDKFNGKKFGVMIIDEGHTIKNRFTKFAKAIMTINAEHKIALTGTPMENNTLELWSLFNFIMPGFLNDFNSFKKFVSSGTEENYKNLQYKISPFILRRTKKDVLKDLPEKNEKLMFIDFNPEQKILYFNLLESIKKDIDKSILEKDIEKNKIFILSLLTKLRQLCCSPKLLYENAKTNGNKFDVCIELIDEIIEKGEKVLLFSQFTEMISIFQKELYSRNIEFLTITGNTAKKERQNLVELFNSNDSIKVFLISLKAGGVGLNLTSANNVIHYDLWWNVSVENQASDRAHRIGQKNNVTIYKLVMNDSIEEKIIDIQNTKKELINKILDFNKVDSDSFSMKQMLKILEIKKFD